MQATVPPPLFVNLQELVGAYKHLGRIAAGIKLPAFREAEFDNCPSKYILCSDREHFVGLTQDTAIAKTLYMNGHFDFEKFEFVYKLCGRVLETIVDVGANIGTICIPAVSRGLVKKAIAIEPDPTNYRLLMANIYLNDLQDSMQVFNAAAGAADNEVLELELSDNNMGDHRVRVSSDGGSFKEENRKTVRVRSETLTKMCYGIPVGDPKSTLVWIDTQGYEGFVLAGADELLRHGCPLAIEFWPYGMKRTGSYALLRESLVRHYHSFYNLAAANPTAVAVSFDAIDALYEHIGTGQAHTDLLFL